MKKNYHLTEISITLFETTDLLTASGDDAIVKDGEWDVFQN